jgi:serine/threonine protein kinase
VIGTTLGNHRITKLLSEGGLGKVYLAQHASLDRKVAVKVMRPELAADPESVARFFVEAKAASGLRHPNIVDVYDFGTLPDGAPYLVMEFLEGNSLAHRLKQGNLRLREAMDIISQVAAAVGAAHARGIVHRDLKPDNLFLVQDVRRPGHDLVKVLDFGIAKLQPGTDTSASARTRTGALVGTPTYMSPEQCRGNREIGPGSDIYSLGVIFYEAVCGRPPFVSDGMGELITMHVHDAPAAPRTLVADLPQPLENLVLRMLAKDPEARFASMNEVIEALAPLMSEPDRPLTGSRREPATANTTFSLQVQPTLRAPDSATASAPPRRWTRVIGVGAVLGAMAIIALALLSKGSGQSEMQAGAGAPTIGVEFDLPIETIPPGATVIIAGKRVGQTPTIYRTAPSSRKLEITFQRNGYDTEVVTIVPQPGAHVSARLTDLGSLDTAAKAARDLEQQIKSSR